MTESTIRDQIIHAMARAFFAVAFADQADMAGVSLYGDVMDNLPYLTDAAASRAAMTLLFDMESLHKLPITTLYYTHGEPYNLSPSDWGHYLAMQAMGTGVGLYDYGIDLQVPSVEFGCYSLERDYF